MLAFFGILLSFLFFPRSIFSAPSVTVISTTPEIVVYQDSFTINFTISNADIGSSYHYKTVGVGVSLDNLPDSGCDGDYHLCSTLAIDSDQPVNASVEAKITSGSGSIKVRIAKADNHGSTYTSPDFAIALVDPTPTLTPIPPDTPTPTDITPTEVPPTSAPPTDPPPTSTLTPTKTPSPTKTPTPTRTPTPSPSTSPWPTATPYVTPDLSLDEAISDYLPTPSTTGSVLGIAEIITPKPTPAPPSRVTPSSVSRALPYIFIGLGCSLLIIPTIITYFHHRG